MCCCCNAICHPAPDRSIGIRSVQLGGEKGWCCTPVLLVGKGPEYEAQK